MVSICGVPVPVLLYIVGPTPRWRLVVCWLSWSMMAPLRPRRQSVSDVIEGYAAAAAAAPAHNKHYSNPPRPANNTSTTVRNRENGNVLEDSKWCILRSTDYDDNLLLDIPHTVR